jgi:hypothetical protein
VTAGFRWKIWVAFGYGTFQVHAGKLLMKELDYYGKEGSTSGKHTHHTDNAEQATAQSRASQTADGK